MQSEKIQIIEPNSSVIKQTSGYTVYNPLFIGLPAEKIVNKLILVGQWIPYGFTKFYVYSNIGTVVIEKTNQ